MSQIHLKVTALEVNGFLISGEYIAPKAAVITTDLGYGNIERVRFLDYLPTKPTPANQTMYVNTPQGWQDEFISECWKLWENANKEGGE